jgi:serine/threonine protein phosphatase PrpC
VKLRSFAATATGTGHATNEDAHLADDARGLYLVSDGLGRHRGAAEASRWVVAEVSAALRVPGGDVRPWLILTQLTRDHSVAFEQ